MLASMASGEGLVCTFRGPGTVWVQSRSADGFQEWLATAGHGGGKGGGGGGGGRGGALPLCIFILFFIAFMAVVVYAVVYGEGVEVVSNGGGRRLGGRYHRDGF